MTCTLPKTLIYHLNVIRQRKKKKKKKRKDKVENERAIFSLVRSQLVEGIVISGGPSSVYETGAPRYDIRYLTHACVPVLGICYGLQSMCFLLGGGVSSAEKKQYGEAPVRLVEDYAQRCPLLRDVEGEGEEGVLAQQPLEPNRKLNLYNTGQAQSTHIEGTKGDFARMHQSHVEDHGIQQVVCEASHL